MSSLCTVVEYISFSPSSLLLDMASGGSNRGPWWRLFTSNGTVKYKSNGSYLAAWCKKCTEHHMSENRLIDAALLAKGEISVIRTEEELRRLGKF